MILTIIITLLIFGVLITTHEFGHFIVARKCGVIVEEFSIGMGPLIFERKGKDNTVYSLRALPVGGYCKMYGEDEDENECGEGSLNSISPFKRILVLAAGATMNLISAIVIILLVYSIIGTDPTNTIGKVVDGSPAYKAGIVSGDTVERIGNRKISSWNDLSEGISSTNGKPTDFYITKKDGSKKTVKITTVYSKKSEGYIIGIQPKYTKSPASIIKKSFTTFFMYIKLTLQAIIQLIRGAIGINELSGPIGVAGVVNEAISYGPVIVLNIAALLAINIGIFNLLPIPALDGSRIFFCLVEIMKGSPINREREGFVHFVGFVLLMGLAVVVAIHDIIKLF